MFDLISYVTAIEGRELPPIKAPFYEYVFASNGIFVRGKRAGLEACIPIGGIAAEVRGLGRVEPYCKLLYPKIPGEALQALLKRSRDVCVSEPIEALFHFSWNAVEGVWEMAIPEQDASGARVKPLSTGEGTSYTTSVCEVHSHHTMQAFFSPTDNKDEQGFKLYGVIGTIFSQPTLKLRVGCYGYYWEVPASDVFDVPEGIADASLRLIRRQVEEDAQSPPLDDGTPLYARALDVLEPVLFDLCLRLGHLIEDLRPSSASSQVKQKVGSVYGDLSDVLMHLDRGDEGVRDFVDTYGHLLDDYTTSESDETLSPEEALLEATVDSSY